VGVGFVLGLLFFAPRADACGAAYPGGPIMCDYPHASSATPSPSPVVRLSASYAFTSTVLLFGDGRRADLTRSTIFGGVEIPLSRFVSLQVGAGGVAGGALDHGAAHDSMGPGYAGFVGAAWRVFSPRASQPWPFVQLSATLSATHLITQTNGVDTDGTRVPVEAPSYNAFDLRAAAIFGRTFADVLTPYAVGRVFGGPAYWHYDGAAVTGTDLHKFQVGAGLSLALFDRKLDLFAEGVPLGEAGFAAGLGATFF
jgi:hypothetical protein